MTWKERALLTKLARICSEGRGQEGQRIIEEAEAIEFEAVFLEGDVPRYHDGTPLDDYRDKEE